MASWLMAIFPSDGRKVSHWLVPRVSRLFRRWDSSVGWKGHRRVVSSLNNASRSSLRSGLCSFFIVVISRVFGDSLPSTYTSRAERHSIGFRWEREFYRFCVEIVDERERDRDKGEKNATNRGKRKKLLLADAIGSIPRTVNNAFTLTKLQETDNST